MGTVDLTDGQAMVLAFDMWQEMLINGQASDCKRYEKDFFEFYKGIVKSNKAPFYLMFCAFVGAMDINDMILEG